MLKVVFSEEKFFSQDLSSVTTDCFNVNKFLSKLWNILLTKQNEWFLAFPYKNWSFFKYQIKFLFLPWQRQLVSWRGNSLSGPPLKAKVLQPSKFESEMTNLSYFEHLGRVKPRDLIHKTKLKLKENVSLEYIIQGYRQQPSPFLHCIDIWPAHNSGLKPRETRLK